MRAEKTKNFCLSASAIGTLVSSVVLKISKVCLLPEIKKRRQHQTIALCVDACL